ncbi:hypothetical protein D3871_20580 [Noviherbaspirillum saxi]|uniref:Uncharacterized protein n=2 Tax=Noviherbaspirillum saxi TaxID=2320863 RepID=A0A3A3G2Y3_9BURK|nr:hypothetical protein D3871_20580 [Noviherbaspirillum saxi]
MGPARAESESGTLKAFFFYATEEIPTGLADKCPPRPEVEMPVAVAGIVTDIAVSLIGKAAESLVDAVAARTQAEATTLDVTLPIEGFFTEKGSVAVTGGCLLFHNGNNADASDASLLMSLALVPSFDGSAFRFNVFQWRFNRFLNPNPSHFFQNSRLRDVVLKIEFLTPSSAGLGTRAVFVEHVFQGVDQKAVENAFLTNQRLPWFASPSKPTLPSSTPPGRYGPLNVRITIIETTRPNQFARWVQDIAKEKRTDIANAAKGALRQSLDSNFAATEQMKLNDAAATAYTGYKTAWDDAITYRGQKPKKLDAAADQAAKEKYSADLLAWQSNLTVKSQNVSAKRTLARSAFEAADLSWPGDLPAVNID